MPKPVAQSVVLALDQGTTSSRALVFDADGHVLSVAQRELPQIYPHPGWVEQDPEVIWATQLATAREAMASAGVAAIDVAAIGITNQRETTVVWERATGRPIANAIVWQDRRTAGLCERLQAEGHADAIQQRTGLVIDAYFSGTKVRWILDHVDGAQARAERGELAFGTVDAWLVWKLTGGRVHVTDASNASRTMLFDIRQRAWSDALCEIVGVPRALLPTVVPSGGIAAECDPAIFGAAIPIAGIAGDQQAALFGQRCTVPGRVKNTYGTGCFMLMHTGDRVPTSRHRLLGTLAWQRDGRTEYALEGSVFVAGAAIQWLRDGLGLIATAPEVEALARSVPDTDGVYFVPAFTGLGAPHWDPHARGTICGISRGTTRAHLARAALEAIAFQTADILDCMRADAGIPLSDLRVDGGATRNDLLMQFQADLLGVPVTRAKKPESTALGAAFLAGRAVGVWTDDAQLDALWQAERTFEPEMARDRVEAITAKWHRAVERAKGWGEA
ncbi:MAG: glycerol kinase GlpK [Burkholderiales bacterium]|nr:glycerol kinase GlpK [Burkholderiales bacterium]